MNDRRYKELMAKVGMPNSQSLLIALKQVANEVEHECRGDLINGARAFEVIKKAMKDDSPSKLGSYAHGWHCNIAISCYDSIREALDNVPHEQAHAIGNQAATNFMKRCFDVETKNTR